MNKKLMLGAVVISFVALVVVIAISDSTGFGDIFRALANLNPKLMSLMLLPFVVVLIVGGIYLNKIREERKWKNALLKTRAEKQQRIEAAQKAEREKQLQ